MLVSKDQINIKDEYRTGSVSPRMDNKGKTAIPLLRRIEPEAAEVLTRVSKEKVSIIELNNQYNILKTDKANVDLKARLKTSWRKIYRDLIKYDISKSHQVSLPKFLEYLHR